MFTTRAMENASEERPDPMPPEATVTRIERKNNFTYWLDGTKIRTSLRRYSHVLLVWDHDSRTYSATSFHSTAELGLKKHRSIEAWRNRPGRSRRPMSWDYRLVGVIAQVA